MRKNATFRRAGSLALTIFFIPNLFGQSPEVRRIAELEERVAKLESALARLLEARAGEDTAKAVLADLPSAPAAPVAPPPPPAGPQELLPNLGKIGATTSFFAGWNLGAFSLNRGSFYGGAIELPLRLAPGGRLLYEISAGLSRSSTTNNVTSNVAQVANLAALATLQPGSPANITAAVNGTGPAPFPVTVPAQTNLQLLQVTPFALKYVHTRSDRYRLRPYALAGLGTYVTITNQTAQGGLRPNAELPAELRQAFASLFGNSAPFGGSLIGGQITQARELTARGIPSGQGGMEVGLQTGGGLEWRLSRLLSVSIDARWNRLANGASYWNTATRWGWHF